MRKLFLYFITLALLAFSYSCMNKSTKPNNVVNVVYPKNESVINNKWLVIVVKLQSPCAVDNLKIKIDGKLRKTKMYKTAAIADFEPPEKFFFEVLPGKHKIEILVTGEDINACRLVKEKARRIRIRDEKDFEKLEKLIKSIPTKEYKQILNVETKIGPLIFKPINYFAYSTSDSKSDTVIVKKLVKSKSQYKEKIWIIRENKKTLPTKPDLILPISYNFPSEIRKCFGVSKKYIIASDQGDRFGIYFIDINKNEIDSTIIYFNDIKNKLFSERKIPESWLKMEKNIKSFGGFSIVSGWNVPFNWPVMCSNNIALIPIRLHCIWEQCKPNEIIGYIIFNKNNKKYEIYIPEESKTENNKDFSWISPELLIPIRENIFILNLETATYKILGENKIYKMPLYSKLKKGESKKFGGYIIDKDIIEIKYPGSNPEWIIKAIISSDGIILENILQENVKIHYKVISPK